MLLRTHNYIRHSKQQVKLRQRSQFQDNKGTRTALQKMFLGKQNTQRQTSNLKKKQLHHSLKYKQGEKFSIQGNQKCKQLFGIPSIVKFYSFYLDSFDTIDLNLICTFLRTLDPHRRSFLLLASLWYRFLRVVLVFLDT